MAVDVFCHIYPEEYLKVLKEYCNNLVFEHDPTTVNVVIMNKVLNTWVGFFKKDSHCCIPELRIPHMQKYGVDVQVLTVALPSLEPTMLGAEHKDTVKIARVINDTMSKIQEKHPDKFLGIAEVPISVQGDMLDEAERAIVDLGLKGVQLYTQMNGMTPESPKLFPLYEKLSKYDVPVLIHPANPLPQEYRRYERDYLLYYIFGWPYETTLAFSRIAFSGVPEKFPKLRFVSHHLGGMISFFTERIKLYEQESVREDGLPHKRYLSFFKSFYHDTAVFGHVPAVQCGYDYFGVEKMMLGTDYPFGPMYAEVILRDTISSVKPIKATEEDKQRILDSNARKFFKIV